MYGRFGKRLLDLVAGTLLCIALLPVMAITACVVLLALGRPILFRQLRAGRNGVPFTMIKFRTMSDRRDGSGELLPDAERLGRVGAFLRATSIDELPELVNVLCGQMSLVGPRPLLVEYNRRYTPRQATRLDVRPGITGLAQINGRNSTDWQRRFEWDVRYVERCSLALDLVILLRTIRAVVRREGISAAGHATMPEFRGVEGQGAR